MSTLETENIAGTAREWVLPPGAAFGKTEGRAWAGSSGQGRVPIVGYRDLLREDHRHYKGIAKPCGAVIGDMHIHLEGGASGIDGHDRTAVRGECLIAQQQAGQQYS